MRGNLDKEMENWLFYEVAKGSKPSAANRIGGDGRSGGRGYDSVRRSALVKKGALLGSSSIGLVPNLGGDGCVPSAFRIVVRLHQDLFSLRVGSSAKVELDLVDIEELNHWTFPIFDHILIKGVRAARPR